MRTLCTIVTAAVVGWVVAAAPVSADPLAPVVTNEVRYTELNDVWSIAHGIACAGRVYGAAVTSERVQLGRDQPWVSNRGRLYVSVGAQFVGLSSVPGQNCHATARVSWRNLDTGRSGFWTGRIEGTLPPFSATGASTEFDTGSGRVEIVLGTDLPHAPSHTTVDVF